MVLSEARTIPERHLDNTIVTMMARRRNPASLPFSPEPFILAVNGLGGQQFHYKTVFEVTPEVVETVLQGLSLQPGYLVTYREVGTCDCSTVMEQVRKREDDSLVPCVNHPFFSLLPSSGSTSTWWSRKDHAAWPLSSLPTPPPMTST